jgi:hypothetical protein
MTKQKWLVVSALLALLSWPALQAQTVPGRGLFKLITSYDDDPFVADAIDERLPQTRFGKDEHGQPMLRGDQVRIEDEPFVYRANQETGDFEPFAINPWPAPLANADGAFTFPDEPRFPLHLIERDADGKPVLNDEGLQLWKPRDQRRGMTTTFEAAHAAKEAAELWSGRALPWGDGGSLLVNTHAFIGFNAFFSPSARGLFFGVVPHRLPGQTEIKMFETATSWEIAAHEAGHALHSELKPNRDVTDPGYRAWTESFSDQIEMWASLRDADRVRQLLADTRGNLNQSNALTRIAESLGVMIGDGSELRDAFHDKKVSDTSTEVHDRSEVLTGAAYKFFLTIYDELRPQLGAEEAVRQAGNILGFFVTRSADYVPENQMTLADVTRGWLKVDKEYFGYRYHQRLVDEFTRREIFDADSVREWLAHEAAIPQLFLLHEWPDQKIEQVVLANQHQLGLGPDFGVQVQSITRLEHNRRGPVRRNEAATIIVRVQLTQGRGDDAPRFDNHGILVFRPSGMLADFHSPLPPGEQAELSPNVFEQTQALAKLGQAHQFRLASHGAPLALVRQPSGPWSVEARVLRGQGINTWIEVFSLDNPKGERREIVIPPCRRIRQCVSRRNCSTKKWRRLQPVSRSVDFSPRLLAKPRGLKSTLRLTG